MVERFKGFLLLTLAKVSEQPYPQLGFSRDPDYTNFWDRDFTNFQGRYFFDSDTLRIFSISASITGWCPIVVSCCLISTDFTKPDDVGFVWQVKRIHFVWPIYFTHHFFKEWVCLAQCTSMINDDCWQVLNGLGCTWELSSCWRTFFLFTILIFLVFKNHFLNLKFCCLVNRWLLLLLLQLLTAIIMLKNKTELLRKSLTAFQS